ncbi:hypothetical protein CY0110_17282 [Crocosphaera chwakensis CCY0110]|uniref:Uncharacterized protein n=1 Tax=Crocosphaera chwakensis CCY0110 TaxID=391612 RepID=A3IID8_9CHRO|nr:hypothetical protein CY0110_17282 [Crocosphaera chwakensis CCY0110]
MVNNSFKACLAFRLSIILRVSGT